MKKYAFKLMMFGLLGTASAGTSFIQPGKTCRLHPNRIEHRKSRFTVLFDGFFQTSKRGDYKFYTGSDGGGNHYINNEGIVNNDCDHGSIEKADLIR